MADNTALATRPADLHTFLGLDKLREQIEKSIPKGILTVDRQIRMAETMIRKTPGLLQCTKLSLTACIFESAQLGLVPDSVLGEVFFIPYKSKDGKTKEAQLQVGYKGFEKLIFQTGQIYKITAAVIRKGEKWSVTGGTKPDLYHEPRDHGEENGSDKTWTHAYAVLHYNDGHTAFELLERAEVFRRRSRSSAFRQGKKDSPWFTDSEMMWKKSAIRAAAAHAPKSTTDMRLARAIAIDDYTEAGLLKPTETGFELADDATPGQTLRIAESTGGEPDADTDERMPQNDRSAPPEKTKRGGKKDKPKDKPAEKKTEPIDPEVMPPAAKGNGKPIPGSASATVAPGPDPFLTGPEYNKMYQTGQANGWNMEEIGEYLKKNFGTSNPAKLTRSQLPAIMKAMESGTT